MADRGYFQQPEVSLANATRQADPVTLPKPQNVGRNRTGASASRTVYLPEEDAIAVQPVSIALSLHQ